ncbi:MAG: hypothetical protein ACYDAG_12750, partial [Chloroflexota bacterium]
MLWALVLAFFWPLITPDGGARESFARGDFTDQFFPFHTFAARELAAGRLALWDPYMYSGYPFQADIQTAVTYPIAFLNEWLHRGHFTFLALEWEAVVHFGLAATFTFLLVKLLTGRPSAGLLAAVAFTFSGFLTSYPDQQLPVLESTVWLPLELYCIERATRACVGRRKEARSPDAVPNRWRSTAPSIWLGLAGGSVGLSVLAGHPQTVLYLAYLGAAYFLFRMPWRAWWQAIWCLVASVGLSAVQLLPSLQLLMVNHKGKLNFSFAAGGLTWSDLPGVLLAHPSGGRLLYLGLVPLALTVLALVAVGGRYVWFWTGVAAISLLLSLGTHGPLFGLFFAILPGWNLFRDQERAVVMLAMAGSILAGYGLAWLDE